MADTLKTEVGEAPNLAEAIRRRVEPLGGIELAEHPAVVIEDPAKAAVSRSKAGRPTTKKTARGFG